MEQLVMNALMSATARRTPLTEYAQLEYSRVDAPRIETGRPAEYAAPPTARGSAGRPPVTRPDESVPVRSDRAPIVENSNSDPRIRDSVAATSYDTPHLSRPGRESNIP
jgi:hypothetical protein